MSLYTSAMYSRSISRITSRMSRSLSTEPERDLISYDEFPDENSDFDSYGVESEYLARL